MQEQRCKICNPVGLVQASKQPKCPKVIKESATSDFVSLGRKSQKSLSHRANPVSHRGKQPKTRLRTVQLTVLGLRPGGLKTPFALSLRIMPFLNFLAVLTLVPGRWGRNARRSTSETASLHNIPSPWLGVAREWGEELQGLKSWAWLLKFCRTFGVLQEGSAERFTW